MPASYSQASKRFSCARPFVRHQQINANRNTVLGDVLPCFFVKPRPLEIATTSTTTPRLRAGLTRDCARQRPVLILTDYVYRRLPHGVRAERFNSQASRLFCSIGVNLNSVPARVCVFEQARESRAISNARIKSRELGRKCEAISEALGLDCRKGKETEFGFAVRTIRGLRSVGSPRIFISDF